MELHCAMKKNLRPTDATPAEKPSGDSAPPKVKNSSGVESPLVSLLNKIQKLLDADRPEAALNLVEGRGLADPAAKNARGVCLMRAGRMEPALKVFRELTLAPGGVWFRPNVPLEYKTNLATALLLNGLVSGCLSVLDEIVNETSPRVQLLRAAIARWKAGLSWGRWIWWWLGSEPDYPIPLDFAAGELKWPDS
jgi:hypothetical protein